MIGSVVTKICSCCQDYSPAERKNSLIFVSRVLPVNSHWKLVMEVGGQPPRLRAENESEVKRERNLHVYLSLQ